MDDKTDVSIYQTNNVRMILLQKLNVLSMFDYQTYLYALLELYEFFRQNIDTKKLVVSGEPNELPITPSPFYINGGYLLWILYFEIGNENSIWDDFVYKGQFEFFRTLDIDIRGMLYENEGNNRWRKCDNLLQGLTNCLNVEELAGNERLRRVYDAIDVVLAPVVYESNSKYRLDNKSVFLNQNKYRTYSFGRAMFSNCKINVDFQIQVGQQFVEEHIIDMDLGMWTRTGINQYYNFTNTQVFIQGSYLYEEVVAQLTKTLEVDHEPSATPYVINVRNKILLQDSINWIKYVQGYYRAQMVIHLFTKLKDLSSPPPIFSIFYTQNQQLWTLINYRFINPVVLASMSDATSSRLQQLISILENSDPVENVSLDIITEWFSILLDFFSEQSAMLNVNIV